jgi:hypothetical protein
MKYIQLFKGFLKLSMIVNPLAVKNIMREDGSGQRFLFMLKGVRYYIDFTTNKLTAL